MLSGCLKMGFGRIQKSGSSLRRGIEGVVVLLEEGVGTLGLKLLLVVLRMGDSHQITTVSCTRLAMMGGRGVDLLVVQVASLTWTSEHPTRLAVTGWLLRV